MKACASASADADDYEIIDKNAGEYDAELDAKLDALVLRERLWPTFKPIVSRRLWVTVEPALPLSRPLAVLPPLALEHNFMRR